MGANLDYRTYFTDDKKEIQSNWDQDVQHSQDMDGHSYSGCIGMLGDDISYVSKIFNSVDEAKDYISETHRKWDSNPLAVPFRIQGGKKVPAYLKNAKTKYDQAREKQRQIVEKIHKDITINAQSKFISCKNCISKINRSFLRVADCPVCRQNLISETSMQRIEKAKQKTRDMLDAWKEAEYKARKTNCTGKIGYVVGGICSS